MVEDIVNNIHDQEKFSKGYAKYNHKYNVSDKGKHIWGTTIAMEEKFSSYLNWLHIYKPCNYGGSNRMLYLSLIFFHVFKFQIPCCILFLLDLVGQDVIREAINTSVTTHKIESHVWPIMMCTKDSILVTYLLNEMKLWEFNLHF